MKVLYVLANAEPGGAERATLLFMREHDRRRYVPAALFFRDGSLVDKVRSSGIETTVLRRPFRLSRPWQALRATAECATVIRRSHVELVHTCMAYAHIVAGPAAKLCGVPVCMFQHGPVGGSMDRAASVVSAAHVLANSALTARRQREVALLRREVSVLHIATGVPIAPECATRFRDEINRAYALDEGDVVIGILARFDPWKGIDVALRAAAPLLRSRPDVKFMVVGDQYRGFHPGYGAFLRELTRTERIAGKVLFAGFQPDTVPYMARIDIVVQASTFEAGFGLTVIEGMFAGKAVVATQSSDEVVADGVTGLLYPAGDVAALTRCLGILVDDVALRRRLGDAARAQAARVHSVPQMMARLESTYDTIMSR